MRYWTGRCPAGPIILRRRSPWPILFTTPHIANCLCHATCELSVLKYRGLEAGLRPAWSAHSNRKNSSRPSFFGGLSLLSSSFGGHKKRRRLGLAARARPPRRFTSDELMSSKSKIHFGAGDLSQSRLIRAVMSSHPSQCWMYTSKWYQGN